MEQKEENIPILEIKEESPEDKTLNSNKIGDLERCKDSTKKISIISAVMLLLTGSMIVVRYGFVAQIAIFLNFVKNMGWWGNFMICFCFVIISFPLILGAYIPLTLGAGAIYGVLMGTVTVSVGSTGGACVAFWICRAFTRKWLEESLKKKREFRYFLAMMQGKDKKFVTVLARLSPIPFGLQNGFFALTDISFRDFFLSTWIGLLPFQIVWTHLGTTLHNLSKISNGEVELSVWQQISMGIQVLMAVILLAYFYYLSKKINRKDEESGPELDLEKGNLSTINPNK